MESICKTQCRSVTIGLPKRFTRKNPRILSIRGFFRRNYVWQIESICQTPCPSGQSVSAMSFELSLIIRISP